MLDRGIHLIGVVTVSFVILASLFTTSISGQQTTQEEPTTDSFIAKGDIKSLIYTSNAVWIATGPWEMVVEDGEMKDFRTDMVWHNSSGTASHTHEISNFELDDESSDAIIQPYGTVSLLGESEVGTNGVTSWEDVFTAVDLRANVLVIALSDEETEQHFAAQPVYGLIESVTPCSDRPGPNMEVLPPCELSPAGSVEE